MASDGIISFIPYAAETRIMFIDPWKEYTSSLENNIEQHPEQLGYIFNPSDDMHKDTTTNFDRAVTKFGYTKVFAAFEACTRMHPADQIFVITASFSSSVVSVIYHLLRQLLSVLNYIH